MVSPQLLLITGDAMILPWAEVGTVLSNTEWFQVAPAKVAGLVFNLQKDKTTELIWF